MRRLSGWVIAALLLGAPAALAQTPSKQFTVGTLSGASYTNAYFGMSLNIPAGWQALGDAKKEEMGERGAKNLGQSIDAETQRAAEEALKTTTFNMLTIIKYGADQKPEGNIMVAAERLPKPFDAVTYLGFLYDLSKRDRSIVELGEVKIADHWRALVRDLRAEAESRGWRGRAATILCGD